MNEKKAKVCLISTSPILSKLLLGEKVDMVGGAEVQQTLIAKTLKESGYGVCALVHDLGQPYEVINQDGLQLIKAYRKGSGGIGNLLALKKAMKRASPDLFYQRAPGSVTGMIALLCKLSGRPFAVSTSTDMDLDGTKEKGMNPIKRAVYRFGIKGASLVVVQTDEQNAFLEKRFGKEGFVIRNTYAPPEASAEGEHGSVIWVASFRDLKRPEMFLDLASRLPDERFVMLGGPYVHQPEIFEETRKKAESIPNIHLTGHIPYAETGKHFDGAKILVCTSTVEGFPNTFLQAWSRGIPVVSTVDPDTLIQRLGLGRFCRSVDELVDAVRTISSDDSLRRSIGEKAAEYVNKNHHPDAVRTRYDELVLRLTGGRG